MSERDKFMGNLGPSVFLAGLLLLTVIGCRSPVQPEEPAEVKKTGNLKGTITGMFTGKTITQGEVSLLARGSKTPEYRGNGNGVYITHYQSPTTNQRGYHNPWQNTPFELLQPPKQNHPATPRTSPQQRKQKQTTRKHR
jgi:hypothetical protein